MMLKFAKKWLAAVLFLVAGCSIDKPEAPQWHLPVNIPLIDSTFSLASLVQSVDDIVISDYGLLGLKIDGVVDTTRVAPYLTLEDIDYDYRINFEEFVISALPPLIGAYTFAQLSSQAAGAPATPINIDPFSFTEVQAAGIDGFDFASAHIKKSVASLTIANSFPVDVNNIALQIQDKTTGTVLYRAVIDTVPSSSVRTVTSEISEVDITPNIEWRITGQSPGSGGKAVTVNPAAPLSFSLSLSNVIVNNISAKLPAIDFSHTENVPLSDSVAIQEARFLSGRMQVNITNRLPAAASIVLTLQEFVSDGDGTPFTATLNLRPDESSLLSIDLSDYVARMSIPEVGQVQKTPITISGTLASSSERVSIEGNDGIAVSVRFLDLHLDYIEGRMNEKQVVIDEMETGISLPIKFGGLEGLKLGDARFTMNVYNTINFPMRLNGKLKGEKTGGESVTVQFDESITPSPSGETLTRLTPFQEGDNDILTFINLPPDLIFFSSTGFIGDGVTIGEVSGSDYMRAEYTLEIAARAVWERRQFVVDTTRILIEPDQADLQVDNVDKSLDSEMTKNLKKLLIHSEIENHIPAGLGVSFRFADNIEEIESAPDLVLGPVLLSIPELSENGIVTKSVKTVSELSLDENDLELFRNSGSEAKYIFIATDIEIQDSKGKEVQLFSNDFIRLQSYLNLVVNVNGD